jgi:hypothetical protein
MSIAVMTAVFKVNLPPSEKVVALALADHAHDDGTEARPGVASLAVKCSLSERQVQRVLKILLAKRILSIQRYATKTTPVCYRFSMTRGGSLRGDNLSSNDDTGGSPGVTPEAESDTSDVTLTVNEPSEETSRNVSDVASDAATFEAKQLCAVLQKHIVANGFKPFAEGKSSLAAMERLLRIDQRTPDQVRYIIEWCQRDEFWLGNIRSPQKLRDKFDTLIAQATRNSRGAIKFLQNHLDERESVWS